MRILADDVVGIGDNGTVDELVVVGVGGNQTEMVLRVEHADIGVSQDSSNDVVGKYGADLGREYLDIFADNLVADTDDVFAVEEGLPRWAIITLAWNHPQQAIGVKDYVSHRLCER